MYYQRILIPTYYYLKNCKKKTSFVIFCSPFCINSELTYNKLFWICLRILPYFLCYLFVLQGLKGKMIYVRLNEANQNVNSLFQKGASWSQEPPYYKILPTPLNKFMHQRPFIDVISRVWVLSSTSSETYNFIALGGIPFILSVAELEHCTWSGHWWLGWGISEK